MSKPLNRSSGSSTGMPMCGSSITPFVPMKMEPWPGIFCVPSSACTSAGGRSSPSYQVTFSVLPSV